jgi:hypothetical protein
MKFSALSSFVKTGLLIALVAIMASTNMSHAAKSGYYKWTDDNGKLQFTQTPPAGRPSVFVATATGEQSKSPNAEPDTQSTAASNKPTGNLEGTMEPIPEKDPAKCKQAKANLDSLKSKARIRLTSPDGTQRFITDEERNTQIKLAEDNISMHCDK